MSNDYEEVIGELIEQTKEILKLKTSCFFSKNY